MAHFCYEWKCLPNAGGLYDQDPLYVAVLTAYSNAVAQKQERDMKTQKGKMK